MGWHVCVFGVGRKFKKKHNTQRGTKKAEIGMLLRTMRERKRNHTSPSKEMHAHNRRGTVAQMLAILRLSEGNSRKKY